MTGVPRAHLRLWRPTLALTASLILLAACAADQASTSPVLSSARPSVTDDSGPIGTGQPADLDECVAPPQVCDGPLPPGSYESTSLGQTIRFELGEDWAGLQDLPDEGFALVDRSQRAPAAVTVTSFPAEVFTDPCGVGPTEPVPGGAAGAADWTASRPFLADPQRTEATLGGLPAEQLDATVRIGNTCPDPVVFLWPLPVSVEFHLNEGEQVRFFFVDAEDRTLAIIAEAFPDADVPGFLDRASSLLETMSIAD